MNATAGSLRRRYARPDEVKAIWRPMSGPVESQAGGVFGHLRTKAAGLPGMDMPQQTMTWDKFQRIILPTADRIEMLAPHRGAYAVLVTAADPHAPPILQWDLPEARNPVSWYFWHGGSTADQFGLRGGQYVEVIAITLKPSMWNGGNEHQGKGVMFLMAGARETRNVGSSIFPEILKAEYRGIRSVLEANSDATLIEEGQEPHAIGIMLNSGDGVWDARLRVQSGRSVLEYKLDRWD